MSSVKAKFPSISIKRRPKNTSAPTNAPGVLRPLTPVGDCSGVNFHYFSCFVYLALQFVNLLVKFSNSLSLSLSPKETQRRSKGIQASVSPTEPFKTFHPISSPTTDFASPITRNSSETNLSSLENLSRSFPDVRTKYVRSASQPNKPTVLHRESVSSAGHGRSSSVNSEASYLGEFVETPMIDQEDIIALTHHVRGFSDALACLRNTFIECEGKPNNCGLLLDAARLGLFINSWF